MKSIPLSELEATKARALAQAKRANALEMELLRRDEIQLNHEIAQAHGISSNSFLVDVNKSEILIKDVASQAQRPVVPLPLPRQH